MTILFVSYLRKQVFRLTEQDRILGVAFGV